jgi:hypothetical protein
MDTPYGEDVLVTPEMLQTEEKDPVKSRENTTEKPSQPETTLLRKELTVKDVLAKIPDFTDADLKLMKKELENKINQGIGRPTVMTEAIVEKLKQAYLFGCTDSEACAFAGINKQTLYNYQEEHKDFIDQKNEWKENPILKAKATIYQNLDDAKVAAWYLERKKRDEFHLRQELASGDAETINKLLDKVENNYGEFSDNARKSLQASGAIEGQVVADESPVQNPQ